MSIIEGIQIKLDQDEYEAGVFADLKKAFDIADHDILINILKHYGVRGVKKEWFCSYPKNRKQFVSINGFVSNTKHISSEVPQGSILRSFFFLIYISDLHTYVKYSKNYNFADDTNLYSNKSLKKLVENMNHDLKSLSGWLKANKLCCSVKKTELIFFRPHTKKLDHPLKFKLNGERLIIPTHSVKYGGVLLEEHLKWTKQVTQVKIKLY